MPFIRAGNDLDSIENGGCDLESFLIRVCFFLVNYVEERSWWPIQSPKKGRKKKAKD